MLPSGPSDYSRSAETVDLWVWPLDVLPPVRADLHELLSAQERYRAGRFRSPDHAAQFVVAHGRLRQILGHVTGAAPGALVFVADDHGKPRLANSAIHFNLSHTRSIGAVAVAAFEVGLDIEGTRDLHRDLDRFFSVQEQQALRALSQDDWTPAFLRCWTRKEAVVKALGLGLAKDLSSFSVSLLEREPARVTWMDGDPSAAETWSLQHLRISADCVGAIAARRLGWTVRRQAAVWTE